MTLLSIIGYARSGALDYAYRLLRDGGYDQLSGDPAALCVVGRLLKDRALSSGKAEQSALYLEAAKAYARAGAINGAAYPLINAATLSLLAGEGEQAKTLAAQVLEICERGDDEAETVYYRAATKAEALLLLGDVATARSWLAEAMARAPLAYEDHASTLRQFGLILDALGQDPAWLDACRPPRSLHFAGHMGLASGNAGTRQMFRAFIQNEKIGFGYGALAAGADILIAEALVEHGAELHVLLPSPVRLFREVSVAAFGSDWALRFDRLIAQAASVSVVGIGQWCISPNALQIANEVAMGCAVMRANALMTEAVQLVVLDSYGAGTGVPGSSQWAHTIWAEAGRRQHTLILPRENGGVEVELHPDNDPGVELAALLRIEWLGAEGNPQGGDIAGRLAIALAPYKTFSAPARWTGEAVVVSFDTPLAAARAALATVAALDGAVDLRIAAHYGLVKRIDDPFGGPPLLTGSAVGVPRQILLSTPPGAVHVTEEFAAALHSGAAHNCPLVGYIGDLPEDKLGRAIRLFALRARPTN